MARFSVELVIVLLCMNLFAGFITASGVGAALNINPELGQEEAIDDVEEEAQNVTPGGGIRDTLQGLYSSVTDGLQPIFMFIWYGPYMLSNLGVPEFLTTGVSAIITLMIALDVVYLLTNRGEI